jgi:hypothetical protein
MVQTGACAQLRIERLHRQLGELMAHFFWRKRCLNRPFLTVPVHPACSAARLRTVLGAPKHRQTAKTIVHESLNNYIGRNYSISVKSIDRKPRNVASRPLQRESGLAFLGEVSAGSLAIHFIHPTH